MILELKTASAKLEGELFMLNMKLDKETNLNEFVKKKNKINEIETKIDQYKLSIEAFERVEKMKTVKRRMIR